MNAPATAAEVNPEMLEQCYVIWPGRSWAAVVSARQRLKKLDQGESYPEMEYDRDTVVGYAEMLRQSGRTVALAICIATHLRRFAPNGSLADALKVLSQGLDLQTRGEAQKLAEMERLVEQLSVSTQTLPSLDYGAAPDEWKAHLQRWIDAIHAIPALSPREFRKSAWAAWEARLRAFARQESEVAADINYLRCRAEGSAAGTLLLPRLARTTAADMSDALTTAWQKKASTELAECPAAFGLGLLEALGFDINDGWLQAEKVATVSEFYAGRTVQSSADTRKGLLVIRLQAGSRVSAWPINRTVPLISTTIERYRVLFEGQIDLGRFLAPRLHGILFEVDRIENVSESARIFQRELAWIRERLPAPPPAAGLIVNGAPDLVGVPQELRRFAVSPQDQTAALKAVQ